MDYTLTLLECREIYEHHFNKAMPGNLAYAVAAYQVRREVGDEMFKKILKDVRIKIKSLNRTILQEFQDIKGGDKKDEVR